MKTTRLNPHLNTPPLLFAVAAMLVAFSSARAAGPVSVYYLTAGQEGKLLGVQGSTVVFDIPMSAAGDQFPIAVNSTVRTLGWRTGFTGAEYTLAGVPTGTTYPFPAGSFGDFYDGATNGTANFAWDFNNGAAYRFSATWTAPGLLFTLGTGAGRILGITYDGSNNSLWLSGWDGTIGTKIGNYTLGGTLLSSFTVAHDENAALALDPADGTLWVSNRNTLFTSLTLEQYTRTGTLLGSQVFAGAQATENVLGGEFRIVPEPGSAGLLSLGALLLAARRRKA